MGLMTDHKCHWSYCMTGESLQSWLWLPFNIKVQVLKVRVVLCLVWFGLGFFFFSLVWAFFFNYYFGIFFFLWLILLVFNFFLKFDLCYHLPDNVHITNLWFFKASQLYWAWQLRTSCQLSTFSLYSTLHNSVQFSLLFQNTCSMRCVHFISVLITKGSRKPSFWMYASIPL